MIREERYLVFKYTDLEACLDDDDWDFLDDIRTQINSYRKLRKKEPLTCVVIEEDWPEYEKVWNLLEERIDHPNTLT